MVSGRRIIHNTTFLIGASVVRKLMSFVYFALIARYTGVPTTGLYFLLVSFATLFTALMDFGLSPTLTREASKRPEDLPNYLNSVLGLKLILCLVTSLSGATLISILDYPELTRQLVYIVIGMMALESFAKSFYACLRVNHRMKYEAFGMVVGQALTLILGGIAVWRQWSIYYLILALVVNQLFNFAYSLGLLYIKLNLKPRLTLTVQSARSLIVIAVPFLATLFFDKLLSLDTLLLSYMTNDKTVGIYSIPSTIVGTFFFIPVAMVSAIFPAFSSFHVISKEKLSQTFEHAYFSLLTFILPAAVGISILAQPLIRFIFGVSYGESVVPLQWMSLALIPIFLNYPLGALLNACNRQVITMSLMGISALFHLVLAVLLISRYGVAGLAIATLAGHALFYLMSLVIARNIEGVNFSGYFLKSARILSATAVMGLVLILLSGHLHVIGAIAVGMAVYVVSLILIQGATRSGFDRERAFSPWIGLARQVFD